MPCCYSQVSLLVPLGGGHPLSLPLQPHFHFVESLVTSFMLSHRMSKPRIILSSFSSGVLKPCSLFPYGGT